MRRLLFLCVALACKSGVQGEAEDNEVPETVDAVASITLPDGAMDVLLDGARGFAVGTFDLLILDVSDPAAPLGKGNTGWGGIGLHLAGDVLYVATGGSVRAVGFAGAGREETTYVVAPNSATRVAVAGRRAYAASMANILILDLDNPDAPRLSTFSVGGFVRDVAAAGPFAYAAAGSAGLAILDASVLPPPRDALTQVVVDPDGDTEHGEALAVLLIGDGRVLVGSSDGLTILDVADPTMPARLGQTPIAGKIFDVAGDRAYVIGEPCAAPPGDEGKAVAARPGFHVFDVSNTAQPHEVACGALGVGSLPEVRKAPLGARGLSVSGRVAALADGDSVFFLPVPTTPPYRGEGEGESEAEGEPDAGRPPPPDEGVGGFVDAS